MKSFLIADLLIALSIVSCDILAQGGADERLANDQVVCEGIASHVVVKHPAEATNAIAAAKSKCLAERAEEHRLQVMEQCQKMASRSARQTIPASMFYKDCMLSNGLVPD